MAKFVIPPQIQINFINECQLDCKFCAKSNICLPKEKMCMGEFTDIVRMCVDFGITEFTLSPTVGEAFLDPHINERIDLLASYNKVKKIKVFTNLLKEGPIFKALECPKVELNVSIYGNNPKVYRKRTGHKMYWLFLKNLRTLIEHVYNNKHLIPQIVLYKRFAGELTQPDFQDFNDISRWLCYATLLKIQMWNSEGDTNWKKMLEPQDYVLGNANREGICRYAVENNAINVGGDISMCGMFDINKKLIIGNIHKQPLEDIYSIDSMYMSWLKIQEDKVYFEKCFHCTIHKVQPFTTSITMHEIYGNHVSDSGKSG